MSMDKDDVIDVLLDICSLMAKLLWGGVCAWWLALAAHWGWATAGLWGLA